MNITLATRQAYSEIDCFIELLDDYNKSKIPKKLREFFKREKDNNYEKKIDANRPIKEQDLKEETLAIIALLNLQYWCEDEKEKERLKKIYAQNENKYQEELREKYNTDNLFKDRKKDIANSNTISETSLVEYKRHTIFTKIKNYILNFIKRYR